MGRGLLHENDVESLRRFGEIIQTTFATDLSVGEKRMALTKPEVTMELDHPVTFNVIRLREDLRLGQRIEAFELDCWDSGAWKPLAHGTSIGSCRLLRTPELVTTTKVRLRITESPVFPALSEFGLYREQRTT